MSDDLVRCPVCRGRKKIIGLGLLEKDCDHCVGIGWISKKPVEIKVKKSRKKSIEK